MAKKNFLITDKQFENEIIEFCKLNKIEDIEKFKNDCFKTGFSIEKYGLLGDNSGKTIEIQEKRVEVPVEVIREVEKIVEKPVEVIKYVDREVIKEVVVPKIEYIKDESSSEELLSKIEKLENEKKIFSTKIEELENEKKIFSTKIEELEKIFQNIEKNDKTKQLSETLFNLKAQLDQKNKKIKELEDKITELGDALNTKFATFHPNSNLKNRL
jgi:hypothetical protein